MMIIIFSPILYLTSQYIVKYLCSCDTNLVIEGIELLVEGLIHFGILIDLAWDHFLASKGVVTLS